MTRCSASLLCLLIGLTAPAAADVVEREVAPGSLDNVPFGLVMTVDARKGRTAFDVWAAIDPDDEDVVATLTVGRRHTALATAPVAGTPFAGGRRWRFTVDPSVLELSTFSILIGFGRMPSADIWTLELGPLVREACVPLPSPDPEGSSLS